MGNTKDTAGVACYQNFAAQGLDADDIKMLMGQLGYTATEIRRYGADTGQETQAIAVAVVVRKDATVPNLLREGAKDVDSYLKASMAVGTNRVYESYWRAFESWCESKRVTSLPADIGTVAAYLATLANEGKKAATIDVAKAAISKYHAGAKLADPTGDPVIRQLMRGIRRTIGVSQSPKPALELDDLKQIIQAMKGNDLRTLRNRALLLIAFMTACRRSEVAALNFRDVEITETGATILVRRSKTDKNAEGVKVGISRQPNTDYCAIAAMERWLSVSGVKTGPLFRHIIAEKITAHGITADTVNDVLHVAADDAGLHEKGFAAHSMRSGCATAALKGGATIQQVMKHLRHASPRTTMGYYQNLHAVDESPTNAIVL
jgi:integrase